MSGPEKRPRGAGAAVAGEPTETDHHSLPLFASVNAASTGAQTSRAAFEAIASAVGPIRQRIRDFLVDRGESGATDEEMQLALGLRVQTQTPRRGELVKAGLARDSGRRRTTSSGRAAVVWVSTDHPGGGS